MGTGSTFLGQAGRILNSGQTRSLLLTGNIYDHFFRPPGGDDTHGGYVPLVDLLRHHWRVSGKILLVYEINGPIRCTARDLETIRQGWLEWRTGLDADQRAIEAMSTDGRSSHPDPEAESFDRHFRRAIGNPTVAFELLRQLCVCSREVLAEDLLILVEGADLAVPVGEIASLSNADRRKIAILKDWFSDPEFMDSGDAVVLLAESRSQLQPRVARLPQVVEVEIPSPDLEERQRFIQWFEQLHPGRLELWGTREDLAVMAAGLSLQALRQLLLAAAHRDGTLERGEVITKVEAFIRSQLGDEIVELKKPEHRLEDVVGNARLKRFLDRELIPRFRDGGAGALTGAAVAGPIGGGKTFVFEAVAGELDMVVLVLKNLRSQWFGQTDVIFERLRRVLEALSRVVIFLDEADTQLGGVDASTHATERRLTGKIQSMMSDPRLRGRVFWLLMTARIHLLSPDLRRPGRAGDLIIPVLDPEGDDRRAFLHWALQPVLPGPVAKGDLREIETATAEYSAASFAALRSLLIARAGGEPLPLAEIREILDDLLVPAIAETRRYQTLQALRNCTRRSLLPDPSISEETRQGWAIEIDRLEDRGIR